MNIREALQKQSPSLALQRAAADVIAFQDKALDEMRDTINQMLLDLTDVAATLAGESESKDALAKIMSGKFSVKPA